MEESLKGKMPWIIAVGVFVVIIFLASRTRGSSGATYAATQSNDGGAALAYQDSIARTAAQSKGVSDYLSFLTARDETAARRDTTLAQLESERAVSLDRNRVIGDAARLSADSSVRLAEIAGSSEIQVARYQADVDAARVAAAAAAATAQAQAQLQAANINANAATRTAELQAAAQRAAANSQASASRWGAIFSSINRIVPLLIPEIFHRDDNSTGSGGGFSFGF